MPPASPALQFENAAGQVLAHPAGYAIFVYKPGPRRLADLQALVSSAGQLLLRHGWHHILGDQRQMAPLSSAESAWIVEYWQGHAQRQRGRIWAAVVLAQDVFARLTVSQLKNEMRATNVTYRQFGDEAAAVAWLLVA